MKRIFAGVVTLYVAGVLAVGPAFAEGPAGTPDRRMQMTETITAADYQQIEGGPLLLAAYAVVWVVFFFAVVFLFLRIRRVSAEMRKLESRVERAAAGEKRS